MDPFSSTHRTLENIGNFFFARPIDFVEAVSSLKNNTEREKNMDSCIAQILM
jgi:hypothetical protein